MGADARAESDPPVRRVLFSQWIRADDVESQRDATRVGSLDPAQARRRAMWVVLVGLISQLLTLMRCCLSRLVGRSADARRAVV